MPSALYGSGRTWWRDGNREPAPQEGKVAGDLNLLDLRRALYLRAWTADGHPGESLKLRFVHRATARNKKDNIIGHEAEHGVYVASFGSGLPKVNKFANLIFVAQHAQTSALCRPTLYMRLKTGMKLKKATF